MNASLSKNLSTLFNNISKPNDELEIIFNNFLQTNKLDLESYNNILKYAKHRNLTDKLDIEILYSLDITYRYDITKNNVYRITINDLTSINQYINSLLNRSNSIIYALLIDKIIKKEENISIIEKIKDPKNKQDIEDFDIRLRLSNELNVSKEILDNLLKIRDVDNQISFRYKQRLSLTLKSNSNYTISLDITETKNNNNLKTLLLQKSNYEAEIDCSIKNIKNIKSKQKEVLQKLIEEVNNVKMVLTFNFYLLSNSESKKILENYNNLIGNKTNNLYSMNVFTIQTENILDDVIIDYSITDKADGEHYALFITNKKIYLISSNLKVKYTNIELKNSNYDNTILDGELIFLKNKYLFNSFDILYYKNKDVRDEKLLQNRIKLIDEIILNNFNNSIKMPKYEGKYEINKLMDYHLNNMIKYLDNLNKLIANNEKYVISRKYYMFSTGLANTEIFKYATLLYNNYKNGKLTNWPYYLDGIIFTPMTQKYTNILAQQKKKIYKWKPPQDNTIDFYFKEELFNNKSVDIIDNSDPDKEINKLYKLGNLYVGSINNKIEEPILFRENEDLHICKIELQDGLMKDIEGNVIQSDTVIECYYDSDVGWIPLRTRYDKTYMVQQYKKKYGNFKTVADNNWKSIQDNNTLDILNNLADDKLYNSTIVKLKNKLNLGEITKSKQKETYYKKKVNLAKNMRNFHNYIKSNMIYKYCSKKSVLDVGTGRGGDIMKFYHSKVKYVFGIDVDAYELESNTDGPKSRVLTMKNKFPNFPKMEFSVGDAGIEFNLDNQQNIFKMKEEDINLYKKYFNSSKKFEVFNCQFMIHFVFKSDDTLNNFCKNINNYLIKDGYLLITTLDGDILHNLFKQHNGIIESYYTDSNENKNKFFNFTANYDYKNTDINKCGLNYESYLSWINDDNESYTEYIVGKDYIIKTLEEKANMSLVDTASFSEIYKNYNEFFSNSAKYESEKRTKMFFMTINEFYNKENLHERIFSFLNRMYIFKKN
tara:strand:- start:8462 stop:11449 length:2988 start_codon:yes stop_codon:yes gene_type:complete